jgi:hypothetical protein
MLSVFDEIISDPPLNLSKKLAIQLLWGSAGVLKDGTKNGI